jgi:DNA-binding CsgD family transcriptional regulator
LSRFSSKEFILKDIPELIYIARKTVHWHLENLRRDFDVHTTRALLLKFGAAAPPCAQPVRLSPRGREVLELFMSGVVYRQIAERMGISLSGVRRHREKMLWQNNCESMLELIARYKAQLASEQAGARECVSDEGALWNRKDTL